MSSPKVDLAAALPVLLFAHRQWMQNVQKTVPQPYLDEFFHIPQADAYWQGRWSHWDDKITTPPGVYLWSILVSKFIWLDPSQSVHLSPHQLRYTNFVLPYLMAICIVLWQLSFGRAFNGASTLPRALCIFVFPLFFFFSGLYYTDVFSALTVILSYTSWQAGLARPRGLPKLVFQALHLLSGLLALACRQTNVFWVAVFLGGLQAVHTIKQKAQVYDPLVREAYFEDYFTMIWSLGASIFTSLPQLLLDLWPHIGLLASFAAFVVWNGGVVLGDKTNHVATIHLPQMLYIWPFLLFFSWPMLLPYLIQPKKLLQQLPRIWLIVLVLMAMTAIVHFNTIVHEFILADNRHYTFYVFKILRTQPWLWYALIPVYAFAAWLSLVAIGGLPAATRKVHKDRSQRRAQSPSTRDNSPNDGSRLSFLLVWILSTALSLVTAPLVEPRYFIVPWLIWRLHVADFSKEAVIETRNTEGSTFSNRLKWLALKIAERSHVVEILWYMLINEMTCRKFLKDGFQWPQSPGEVQRFMW